MIVRRLLASALFLSATATVQAQTNLQFMSGPPSPAVTAYGYYVGPFNGTITSDPARPRIDLFCVDVLNAINWGHSWTANMSNLAGDLSQTRHGNAKEVQYKKAAYLASLYAGSPTSQWGGIQSAIWDLLNPGQGGPALNNSAELVWLAQANTWWTSGAASSFDFSRWTVVTEVGAAGVVSGRGTQEFLTTGVTPEPETWVLMGTGLIMIVGFAMRRGFLA